MKRLLITLMTIAPIVTFAQKKDSTSHKWELGLAIGVSSNSVQSDWEDHSFTHAINFASQISIARNIGKHFQAGAEICSTTMAYKGKAYLHYVNNGTVVPETYRVVIGNPALPMYLFANYCYSIKDIKLYAGVAAGYAIATTNGNGKDTYYDKTENGPAFGVQAGLQDKLTRHLSIYLEADVRNLSLHEKVVYYSYLPAPLYYYCGLAGVRYCF